MTDSARSAESFDSEPPPDPDTFDSKTYVAQTLHLLGLTVPPEQMADVVKNFELVQAIAQPVLDFPLPDDLESAQRFEP